MALTITNNLLLEEAKKLGIAYEVLSEEHNILLLKKGKKEIIVRRSRFETTNGVLSYICDHKMAAYDMLEHFGLPCPRSVAVAEVDAGKDFIEKEGFPLVVKPEDGAHGNGVTVGVRSMEEYHKAFAYAKEYSPEVIIQNFCEGSEYRVLMVDYRMIAAANRIPAHVVGDGTMNIQELIDHKNADPRRGDGHQTPLTTIAIDGSLRAMLTEKNLTLKNVPQKGETVFLRKNANLSTGGEARDVTDDVHPTLVALFEKIARSFHAQVVGIDVICKDITKPYDEGTVCVIELNISPGIRMHHFPSSGKSRNVARALLTMVFGDES